MRLITDDELILVSGGSFWDEAWSALSSFFGGSSSVSCTPSSTTNNGTTVTQTCGGLSSTVSITGPGYVIQTTTLGTTATGSAGFRLFTGEAAIANGVTVQTVVIVGGQSQTYINGKKQ